MSSLTPNPQTHNPGGAPEVREILEYLDGLLTPDEFEDYSPNGLQIPGAARVSVVATGVSGQLELFERARELGAELVIVHHGILWDFQPRRVSSQQAARLRTLLCAGIALAAYHLPLDAHPTFGNNALLAERLGASSHAPFGMHRGRPIGVAAHFKGEGLPKAELFDRVRSVTEREPLVLGAGPERVRSLGIVSGAGADSLPEAVARGLDGLLTGEPREHVVADAREAGVHFIAAGHYATETLGVRRLGELVAERFSIKHKFIDIANPV